MKNFILASTFSFAFIFCNAQQWTTYTPPIPGVGYTSINAIGIDAQNNKWCATWRGVFKFDGNSWTTYDTTNSGLANNVVNDLKVDGQNIWFATNKGISKLNGSTWTTYNTLNCPLLSNYVKCIAIAPNGDKWFGGVGAYKLVGATWTIYDTVKYAGQYPGINAIAIDGQNDKWFAYSTLNAPSNSIDKLSGNTLTRYTSTDVGFNVWWINTIAVDAQNNKWFGYNAAVNGGGLYKFDGSTWTDSSSHISDAAYPWVNCIVSSGQNLLIGANVDWSDQNGLYQLNNTGWQKDILGMSVTAIAVDAQGIRWIGTGNGKLMTNSVALGITSSLEEQIALYPNPASSQLFIETNGTQVEQVNIYNTTGSLVGQTKLPQSKSIDVSEFSPGIYVAEIKTKETNVMRRWVKM